MLGLGFSSGLPFLLIGNTLSYWLGDSHVNLALIGYLSWVGLAYSLQVHLGCGGRQRGAAAPDPAGWAGGGLDAHGRSSGSARAFRHGRERPP